MRCGGIVEPILSARRIRNNSRRAQVGQRCGFYGTVANDFGQFVDFLQENSWLHNFSIGTGLQLPFLLRSRYFSEKLTSTLLR